MVASFYYAKEVIKLTVQSNLNKHTYVANGVQTQWPYTFDIFTADGSDICLYVYDPDTGATTQITTGFSVDVTNKYVTYPTSGSAIAAPKKIILIRVEDVTQLVDLVNQGAFYAEVIETSLDKITAILQQHDEALTRAVQMPVNEDGGGDEILTEIQNAKAVAQTSANEAAQSVVTVTELISQAETNMTALNESINQAAAYAASAADSATNAANSVASAVTQATAAALATVPPLNNFTVSGRKVAGVSGFQVNLSAGEQYINRKDIQFSANTVTIPARSAALLYDKADGTTDKVLAVLPYNYIDNNTVGFWDFTNWDGASAIPNSAVGYNGNTLAVVNPLTKTGTVTKVDGWQGYGARGDGSTGCFISANLTGFPTGANPIQIDYCFTVNTTALSAYTYVGAFGGSAVNSEFGLVVAPGGDLVIFVGTNNKDSSFIVEVGKTYYVSLVYDGSTISLYVNGQLVYAVAITLSIAATYNFTALRYPNSSQQFSDVSLYYIEVRNALRTSRQMSNIANALLLPNRYYTPFNEEYINGQKMYDIATQENAISGGDYSNALKANAFNKNTSDNWASSQVGSAVNGVAYIGQKVTSKIKHMRVMPYSNAANNISSVLVQFTADSGTTWTTIQTQALTTTASTVTDFDVADYTVSGTHYIRLLANTSITTSNTWAINELNMYTDVQPQKYTDIRSVLPANAVSLGLVRSNSSGVIAYNDSDYQYGRREKAYGGNRKVFLGWKYFNGATTLAWNNPFGTRKIKTYYTWAQDAVGTNEIDIESFHQEGSSIMYGVATIGSPVLRSVVYVGVGGAVPFNGSWQTAGYIGCYAEILEDDN